MLIELIQEVSIAISSGSLMTFRTFEKIGRFREELFIDYVDTEYCMRAGRFGIPVVAAKDAGIVHSLEYSFPKRFVWLIYIQITIQSFVGDICIAIGRFAGQIDMGLDIFCGMYWQCQRMFCW